ncbi:hypothetical protein [Candidatus Lokiarchaeum ossiferum]|uniref:hypothetical protein n=1 Tax=Candidatus Lokiarchaeum ossiferum TaxID=2951803 RepID=UPI00352C4713
MQTSTASGLEFPLHPADESCPYDYWLPWLKNLALEIIKQTHLSHRKGCNYSAEDFWEILIMHSLMDLSLDEASNELNKLPMAERKFQTSSQNTSKTIFRFIHPTGTKMS